MKNKKYNNDVPATGLYFNDSARAEDNLSQELGVIIKVV